MKFVNAVTYAAIAVVAVFILGGLLLPSGWSVSRSIVVDAPPAKLYPLVADFKDGWPQWSAFDFEDPDIRYSYAGPSMGVGAQRNWTSRRMGDGGQTIVAADPAKGVEFELVMTENRFKMRGSLAFFPEGRSTRVTWTDAGDVGRSLPKRWVARFMNRLMGGTFEKSLAALKARAEASASKPEARAAH